MKLYSSNLEYLRITHYKKKTTDMFGNCFFPLFSVFKNNFLFFKLKTCLVTQNGQKTKTVFKIQFVKETENMQKVVFSFYL